MPGVDLRHPHGRNQQASDSGVFRDLPAPEDDLVRLVYELLDAHGDTAELAHGQAPDGLWEAHLDYLRVLQRVGRERLAGVGALDHSGSRHSAWARPSGALTSPRTSETEVAAEDLRALLGRHRRDCATAVTIGTFDGVHAGHRALVGHTRTLATRRGLDPIALTFSPRPDAVFAGAAALPDLCPLDVRIRKLRDAGAADVIVLPFSNAFAQIGAATFVAALVDELEMAVLCVGEDFALGRGRRGDVAWIRAMGVEVVTPPFVLAANGHKVSSSAMRRAKAAVQRTDPAAID
jgi:riboflavin kinase/FMN adenylyltransferase